ncbi:MAG TPA: DUF4402 domain-containing protein [Sphingorhabdus sp.]|nr:DUF4402 domain-containing protein [Sphingorhabdus sp.]
MLALAMLPTMARAQTVPADGQVAIVTPLSFIQVRDLDFGRVIPSATAGTVTISATNIRSSTGGVTVIGNDFRVARFAGRGVVLQRVRIRITPSAISLTGPGAPMTVDNFTIGPDSSLLQLGTSPNYIIQSLSGVFWFNVGGRLSVNANQAPGTYSGTFTATLDYV